MGSAIVRGVSGGERKRVNIGTELVRWWPFHVADAPWLVSVCAARTPPVEAGSPIAPLLKITNPSLIFLDEPTSGLDAFNAQNVMDNLLILAKVRVWVWVWMWACCGGCAAAVAC